MAGSINGIRYWTGDDEWDPEAFTQGLAADINGRFVRDGELIAAAKSQGDLGVVVARQALEVSLVSTRLNASYTVTNDALGSIPLDTRHARPTAGRFSGSPTRLVCAVSGTYRARAQVVWSGVSGGSAGRRYAQIRKDAATNPTGGSDLTPMFDTAPNGNVATVVMFETPQFDALAGNYVELFVRHTQGAPLALLGGNGGTHFELEFIRPLP